MVLHEMTHSIGFGAMWDLTGLLDGATPGGSPAFPGAGGAKKYADLVSGAGPVPVETDGGAAAGGHWNEDTFDSKLMTGYIDGVNIYLDMTVAALEDMGCETVWESSLIA